jgi:hypothetical protein
MISILDGGGKYPMSIYYGSNYADLTKIWLVQYLYYIIVWRTEWRKITQKINLETLFVK